ncbi:MAG TPA: T9SS type A sorting domain-containing protein [candidate division WOR-3 bacterium]|uniref:T9SS type A sorting domain-containing protein n=1 Tax=candidate division WOR-3 bacterium TaxID=2052148 RepID=A0A9C9EMU5_UNCW3|nr:T9SS type A sorting domain-containing protein [candidate division WOR-3 bacterium]
MYRYYVMMLTGLSMIFASPGDIIGTTCHDLQSFGSFGQRISLDSDSLAYLFWTYEDYPGQVVKYIAANIRLPDGTYYGQIQVSPDYCSSVQVDGLRSSPTEPAITYNLNGISVQMWNQSPVLISDSLYWPYIAVTYKDSMMVVAAGETDLNKHHLLYSTDQGNNWVYVQSFDSCATLSQFVRASRNPGSQRVVFVHTQYITDTIAGGQLDNDIWYMVSEDGGATWGPYINLTSYQPSDTIRAYCNVNAVFDHNDKLHIVWSGRLVTDEYYYNASKIFHWDEVHDTITVVSSPPNFSPPAQGGWWIAVQGYYPGAWRLPADQPQLVVDTTDGYLYCLWHGNDEYVDCSAQGFFNGEIFGSYSTDGGLTWSDYVNLTNTRSPGAGPGECYDEDYATAAPYVIDDSIWITYVEDKDAGAYVMGEGSLTENPVRCWVFSTSLIRTGVEEYGVKDAEDGLRIFPVPFFRMLNIYLPQGVTHIRIYDAAGRLKKDFPRCSSRSLIWYGDDDSGRALAPGVYFIRVSTDTGEISRKVVKLR